MREIKFRAKRNYDNTWVYGSLVLEHYTNGNKGYFIIANYNFKEEVIPETVGQYIGLEDKYGNKIYEGDIIDIHQTVNGCNLFEIVWDKTKWNAKYAVEMVKPRLYEYNFNELLDVEEDETEIEIVGNIYDRRK